MLDIGVWCSEGVLTYIPSTAAAPTPPHPDISSSGSTVSQRHRSLETLFYAQASSRAMSSLSRAPSSYVQYLHASLPKPSSSFPAPQPQTGSPKQEGLYAKAGNRKKADPDKGPVYLPANPSHHRHFNYLLWWDTPRLDDHRELAIDVGIRHSCPKQSLLH